MSSASDSPDPPAADRPSLFLSYSSEDRPAARALRDALEAAGLEVWYDENELGGGDAWDQKIRRQIRECRYFMPVISASTERRSEGYFRREWKLAVERTHDMADDVLFLVPVVIDSTGDGGARVPERFLTVQWLRVPGGQPGPALEALARRLLTVETTPPPRPPPVMGSQRPARPPVHAEGPPPMPPFPIKPSGKEHRLHYLAQVLWWTITAAWLIFKRFPRWVRFILVLAALSSLFKCSNSGEDGEPPPTKHKPAAPDSDAAAKKEAIKQAVVDAGKKLEQNGKDNVSMSDLMRAGAKLADTVAAEIDKENVVAGQIGIVPFGPGFQGAEHDLVDAVHTALFGQLAMARPGAVKPLPAEEAALANEAALLSQAAKAGHDVLVIARRETTPEGNFLAVRALKTVGGYVVWSGRQPLSSPDAPAMARSLGLGLLAATANP